MGEKKIVEVDQDLEDVVPIFLKNREKELDVLADLISQSDFKGMEVIGHKLAGAAGGYDLDELGVFGRNIEFAAQSQDLDTIKLNVTKIKEYLSVIEVKYVET